MCRAGAFTRTGAELAPSPAQGYSWRILHKLNARARRRRPRPAAAGGGGSLFDGHGTQWFQNPPRLPIDLDMGSGYGFPYLDMDSSGIHIQMGSGYGILVKTTLSYSAFPSISRKR